MQLIIIFITYSVICLILTYYVNLIISQTVYTRSELSDIIPQIGKMLQKIYYKHSIIIILGLYSLSGFTGFLILVIFENWLINSALLPVLLYFSAPRIAIYFEQTRVTISDNYKDYFELLYLNYYNYILSGFFSGYASKLIDNWINLSIINFPWFTLNFIILIGLTILSLKNDIFN